MQQKPVLASFIEIREQIVLPLLLIQQYLFQKIETNARLKPAQCKIVQRSLYGNIKVSRNSA